MSMNQKEAVRSVVLAFFPDYVLGGEVILKSLLDTDNKKHLRSEIFSLFRARQVSFAKEDSLLDDDAYLTKYVSGLLDNWVRKDKDFNNGQDYITKNPGSRSGSGDDQIKSLRALKKKYASNPQVCAEIDTAIAERLAVIKPNTVIEINVEALPEQFKHLVAED